MIAKPLKRMRVFYLIEELGLKVVIGSSRYNLIQEKEQKEHRGERHEETHDKIFSIL